MTSPADDLFNELDKKHSLNERFHNELNKKYTLMSRLHKDGNWLLKARQWLQSNVRRGDTLCWSSAEPVSVPFHSFEEFGLKVACAAVEQDREEFFDTLRMLKVKQEIIESIREVYKLLDENNVSNVMMGREVNEKLLPILNNTNRMESK